MTAATVSPPRRPALATNSLSGQTRLNALEATIQSIGTDNRSGRGRPRPARAAHIVAFTAGAVAVKAGAMTATRTTRPGDSGSEGSPPWSADRR